jgi:hypothetical protein
MGRPRTYGARKKHTSAAATVIFGTNTRKVPPTLPTSPTRNALADITSAFNNVTLGGVDGAVTDALGSDGDDDDESKSLCVPVISPSANLAEDSEDLSDSENEEGKSSAIKPLGSLLTIKQIRIIPRMGRYYNNSSETQFWRTSRSIYCHSYLHTVSTLVGSLRAILGRICYLKNAQW